MKVLVDSCIWSLNLRRRSAASLSSDEQRAATSLIEIIRDQRAVIIGPIRQEVLSGIKEPAQFEKVRTALAAFPDEPITTRHYEEAAHLFNLCRSRGVQCGPIDMLICAVALENHWRILTSDQGLKRCLETIQQP